MKNRIVYLMIIICLLIALLGYGLNKVLASHFGNNSSNIVVAVAMAIVLCIILLSIVMKYYSTAILLFIMLIPLGISGIGLYLKSTYTAIGGVAIIFIIYPILLKYMPKLKRLDK